jgi:hypothetical protein
MKLGLRPAAIAIVAGLIPAVGFFSASTAQATPTLYAWCNDTGCLLDQGNGAYVQTSAGSHNTYVAVSPVPNPVPGNPTFYEYKQNNTNNCLEEIGSKVTTDPCTSGKASQEWAFGGKVNDYGGSLENYYTGDCMSTNSAADVIAAACLGGEYEEWFEYSS